MQLPVAFRVKVETQSEQVAFQSVHAVQFAGHSEHILDVSPGLYNPVAHLDKVTHFY